MTRLPIDAGQELPQHLAESVRGGAAAGSAALRIGARNHLTHHDTDWRRQREPPETAPHSLGPEDRHRHDRAGLSQDDVREPRMDRGEAAIATAPFREQ